MEIIDKFTRLSDRKLYYDGDSVVTDLQFLYNKLLNSKDISSYFVEDITNEIEIFNKFNDVKLSTKNRFKNLDTNWNIPEYYKHINLSEYFFDKFQTEVENNNFTDLELDIRIQRIEYELSMFKEYKIELLIICMIYVMDKFQENNVVWGTGRGSSCCSYTLYLLGLHDVDSVLYDLDIKEFLR